MSCLFRSIWGWGMPLPLSSEHFTPLLSFVSINLLPVCSDHDLGGWRDDDLIGGDPNSNSIYINYFVEFDCDLYYHNGPQLQKMAAQRHSVLC